MEGGTAAGVTPKGFTPLSLTVAGPQGQAPARATTMAPWDPIPEGPWWHHGQCPRPVWGTPGFRRGFGWLIPPGCARPSSPSRHALDVNADDSPSAADIAMVTINRCCWDDSCGDAAPAPASTKR